MPHVLRCGTAFVVGGLIVTYLLANVGSAKPLTCVHPMMLIAVRRGNVSSSSVALETPFRWSYLSLSLRNEVVTSALVVGTRGEKSSEVVGSLVPLASIAGARD